MNIKGIIFDLDGTLVNSLEDIADAMNSVLQNLNYPTHTYEVYQYFIGSGLRNLVSKALPSTNSDDLHIDYCYALMIENYTDNCTRKTTAYRGINELLTILRSQNIKLALFSNKADALTKKVVAELFPDCFSPVIGLTTEALKKPNASEALSISKQLELQTNEMMFIGDSAIDMQTATNAHMLAVGVTWGYRPEQELLANGAKHLLHQPSDLLAILQIDPILTQV